MTTNESRNDFEFKKQKTENMETTEGQKISFPKD